MLKPLSALLALLIIGTCTFGQSMRVKQYNYTSFSTDRKNVPDALNQYSSEVAKQHPEYGVLPPHAQCSECVEIIDKRTINSRYYIDPQQPGRTFSQRSYFPLHYKKSVDDVWHSLDERLRPTNTPGVFIADKQPIVAKSDINRKSTSLISQGIEFEFNKNVTLYYTDADNVQSAVVQSDYSQYTAGDDGVYIKEIWYGVDMEQTFSLGEIKTNYIINQPLDIPINNGYLVIEDHFTLPATYTIQETADGIHTNEGYYQGDYEIKNTEGKTVWTYSKPSLIDKRNWGIAGSYQLIKSGNNYTLKMLTPIAWLKFPENVYPLHIDPPVFGQAKRGNFIETGLQTENFAYTTMALGSCDYYIDSMVVPGKSEILNTYIDLEYKLNFDPACGNFTLPSPYCTFSQVSMEVVSRDCNTSTGLLSCQPAAPPFTGRCTTDSNTVQGARPILVDAFQPNYLNCFPPQCPDYVMYYTLRNRDSICGDVCGYLCATGTMWQMTVEICYVDVAATQNKTQICPGEVITYTATPSCGVPPYTYLWLNTVDNTFDTTSTPTYTFTSQVPNSFFEVMCYVVDACGVRDSTNTQLVDVSNAPTADAGPDQITCLGGAVSLGGNPTTNGNSITWTGSTPTVQSWLTSNSFPNPTANVPQGTVDTFFYVVRTSNGGTCVRRDTVYVYSTDGPIANAGPDLNLCGGGTATLGGTPAASTGYNIEWAGYGNTNANNWLSNPNTENPTVSIPAGTIDTVYYLIQVYNNQCSRRDTMAIFLPQPPLSNAGADVNLCEGGTATLGGTPAAGPGTTVVWSSNDATAETYLSSTTVANPTVTVPAGTLGTYQYYLNVTDPNCSRRDTVLVNSYANLVAVVDTSGPTTICSNTSVTLSVAGNYSSYAWSNGETTQSIAVNTAGIYYAVVTDSHGCTDTSNLITVATIPVPNVIVYPDTSINYGDSLELYTDLDLATVDSFAWYPMLNISCTDCPNPTVAPETDTYYGVQIFANGCPATDSALIKIILKNNFYIPNAFTPNNDGNNDDFYIYTQRGVRVIEFQIYDRIGEKIHDGLYPWDGSYKGKPCQPGTYVYVVRMGLFGEQQGIMRKGSVTLIR